MKIYLIRHEQRHDDPSFYSPLTKEGLTNSQKLVEKLEKLNITKIIVSPFIRTLQTIYHYIKKHNTQINIEHGLVEIKHPDIFTKRTHHFILPTYIAEKFNYNPSYTSIIPASSIKFPETYNDVKIRVKKLLKELINQYYKSNEVILLVTHQCVCTVIMNIINKKNNIDTKLNEYKMGHLTLVFDDDDWIYKSI